MNRKLLKFDGNSYAHFVATKTYKAYPYFRDKSICEILMDEIGFYSRKLGFMVIGYVIMPDHVHLLIWWDSDEKPELRISDVIGRIKTMTSKRVKRYLFYDGGIEYLVKLADVGQPNPSKFRLWQPGYYDFNVYTEGKLLEKLDYMHGNPVKAGLVASPDNYRWSSYKAYFTEDRQPLRQSDAGEACRR